VLAAHAREHWYEKSSRIWQLTGLSPGPGFASRLAEAADWYRESLDIREPVGCAGSGDSDAAAMAAVRVGSRAARGRRLNRGRRHAPSSPTFANSVIPAGNSSTNGDVLQVVELDLW